MSSGECLLISLIDFINNLVIKGSRFDKFLFLIDEVELALMIISMIREPLHLTTKMGKIFLQFFYQICKKSVSRKKIL